ncbi:hypothetical protein SEA_RIKSENGUPTA_23 [Microbacterium phage RikSengupta]|nr:hypothetical protein SEA_RIKSENGUPTA_23 [Microbacterium phage RikSengupta]
MARTKAGLVWEASEPSVIAAKMKGAVPRAQQYLARTTELYSLRSETFAKSKAPWTDRTTNARSGLGSTWLGEINGDGARFEIDIFHRVPYGIWLELKYNGKFSIINKTLQNQGPKYFNLANQVMARMFGGS